jgi:hypothetical protein
VQPFRRIVFAEHLDGLEREMASWPDLHDENLLDQAIARSNAMTGSDRFRQADRLDAALTCAGVLGEQRCLLLLERAESLLDALPPGVHRLLLLDRALSVAAKFQINALGQRLGRRVEQVAESSSPEFAAAIRECRFPEPQPVRQRRIEGWPSRCIRRLRQLHLHDEAQQLELQLRAWISPAGLQPEIRGLPPDTWLPALRATLELFGESDGELEDESATTVLNIARKQLLYVSSEPTDGVSSLACAYVAALGKAPVRVAQGRIEEVFRDLTRLHDIRQTNAFFAASPLRLVDAVVHSVVNDGLGMGPAIRNWVADDDYRIRRRMHLDLQSMMTQQTI